MAVQYFIYIIISYTKKPHKVNIAVNKKNISQKGEFRQEVKQWFVFRYKNPYRML